MWHIQPKRGQFTIDTLCDKTLTLYAECVSPVDGLNQTTSVVEMDWPSSQCIRALDAMAGYTTRGGNWKNYDSSKASPLTIVHRSLRRVFSYLPHSNSIMIIVILYINRR